MELNGYTEKGPRNSKYMRIECTCSSIKVKVVEVVAVE